MDGSGLRSEPGVRSRARHSHRLRSDHEPLFRRNRFRDCLGSRGFHLDLFESAVRAESVLCSETVRHHFRHQRWLGSEPSLQNGRLRRSARGSSECFPRRIRLRRLVHRGLRRHPNNDRDDRHHHRYFLCAVDATHLHRLRFFLSERQRCHRLRMRLERHRRRLRELLPHGNPARHQLCQRDGDPHELYVFHDDERTESSHGQCDERGGKLRCQYENLYLCGQARNRNRLEYGLILPPNLEWFRMVPRRFVDRVQYYGKHDRMPL